MKEVMQIHKERGERKGCLGGRQRMGKGVAKERKKRRDIEKEKKWEGRKM